MSRTSLRIGDLVRLRADCWLVGWQGQTGIVTSQTSRAKDGSLRRWAVLTETCETVVVAIDEVEVIQRAN